MEPRTKYPSGELKLFEVINIFRGSIFLTEVEEWINKVRECYKIIGFPEDEKVRLVESMLQEESRDKL